MGLIGGTGFKTVAIQLSSQTVGILITTGSPRTSQEVNAYINWLELKAVFLHSLTELWKAQTHLEYSDVPSCPMMHSLLTVLMIVE